MVSHSEDPTVGNIPLNYTDHVFLNDANSPPPTQFQSTESETQKNILILEEKLRYLLCIKNANWEDFPDGPAIKTVLPLQGVRARSLVGELRSHMPRGAAKETHTTTKY